MDKVERLNRIIEDKKRQYGLRQAHIARKEPELKENYAKGKIPRDIYESGKKQLEEYISLSQKEYDQISEIEAEIEKEKRRLIDG